ncbi:hypothetical protein C8Q78DRAFT_469333 [Trametes maxima]|nr:hypothetical protein C8Q78DRAFT_469333 [Trametes maxima]
MAAQEFYQVRVLKQPLSNGSGGATNGGASQGSGKKGLSVVIEVLIGLLGFFVLFGAHFAYMKRRWARGAAVATTAAGGPTGGAKDGSCGLTVLGCFPAPRKFHSSSEPSEDDLRQKRFEAYKRWRDAESQHTEDSARTRVADPDTDEFGPLKRASGDSGARHVGRRARRFAPAPATTVPDVRRARVRDARATRRPSYAGSPLAHQRTLSGGPSAGAPLLGGHAL